MAGVRPKKFLGQHFLKDRNIAERIVSSLEESDSNGTILEIGPGTGVLSHILAERPHQDLILVEVDRESISYLQEHLQGESIRIVEGDFLKVKLQDLSSEDLVVIGNFPYYISSQIFFRILDQWTQVREVVCMIQKEVADRICASEGNKTYGILSVLLGAYYDREMLFKVPPGAFYPKPKVDSAVIKLKRKPISGLDCDEMLFRKIVKQAFQNRRKTLRNALKPIFLPEQLTVGQIFDLRAEQLSVEDFIRLTQNIQQWKT